MKYKRSLYSGCIALLALSMPVFSQIGRNQLSLNDAIAIAKVKSTEAQLARFGFMGQYWNYRSYKAELLPALNLSGGLLNYDRSLVEVRDPETGRISYVTNNSLSNDLTLSIDQNIPFLGGKLSLNSYLSRLDQFDYKNKTYNSNPLTLNYTQPLRSYNSLKWRKKTAPLEYENAKRNYLESMQNITIRTTSYFFSVLSAQANYKKKVENYNDRKKLFKIAQKRYALGTTTQSEILQLELSLLNAEMQINTDILDLDIQRFNLCSYLGIKQHALVELIEPLDVPQIEVNASTVLEKAYQNSSYLAENKLKLLESRRALAQAKSTKGLQADFRANIGFSQSDDNFPGAYRHLRDREVVGISFRMPIFDWGLSKGKVKMAQADLDITKVEIDQSILEFNQNVETKVIQFNNQTRQCEISVRAKTIAEERFAITKKRFENGSVTVTDLNTAQKEFDDARNQHIGQLRIFWSAYYELEKIALYDFIHKVDIGAEFDEITK